MKLIIYLIILIIGFFWMADTKISFSPFKIQCPNLVYAVGIVFLVMGIVLVMYSGYRNGYKEGLKDNIEMNTETKYL